MLRRLAIFAVIVLAGSIGSALPAQAGDFPVTIEVVKEVQGPAPSGALFEVNVTCEGGFAAGFFIEAGETVRVDVVFDDECVVSETNDQGAASVSYACEDVLGVDHCTGDNSVLFLLDGVEDPTARVTITNTFEEVATTSTVEPPTEPPAAQAIPRFTG